MELDLYRSTTEDIGITLKDKDTGETIPLSDITNLRITIAQGDTEITKQTEDGTLGTQDNTALLHLTQDETRALQAGTAYLQAHILMNNSAVRVSYDIAEITVHDIVDRRKV